MGVASGMLGVKTTARGEGTADRVRVGVIGGGNQGKSHVSSLLELDTAQLVTICDVDQTRLADRIEQTGGTAKGVADFRRILDDPSIDAVSIATPDHWHTPAALLALEAGKHVYVEKPLSHNIQEGKLLVAAAKKHNKLVQHGTQSRSNPGFQEAIEMLRGGVIGDVLIAKCWNWQRRKNIGHGKPTDPPATVDYDTWVGPAEWLPYQDNRFHYDWHWWHNFGCGGIGNDGVHEMDYALWGLGVETHPTRISALGGKYFFDDDQQFPDTQQAVFEFTGDGENPEGVGKRRMLIFEQRLWSTTYPYNVDAGAEFVGTTGQMFLSKRGKMLLRGERNKVLDKQLAQSPKAEVVTNFANWIDAIRGGSKLNAPVEVGHRTATALHLANISTRLQKTISFDPQNEQIIDADAQARALQGRVYRDGGHWGVPKVLL